MTRLKVVALIFLAVVLAAVPAPAQMHPTQVAYTTATVPFNFVVTDLNMVNVSLPAGDYSLLSLTPSLLLLKGRDTEVMISTEEMVPGNEIQDSKLVFVDIGGQHYLHQIWTADHKHVHNLVHPGGVPDV